MFRTWLLAATLIVTTAPAIGADWLVFRAGRSQSTELWRGPKPLPGVNVAQGSVVVEFKNTDGDSDTHNYRLEKGELVHVPPARIAFAVDPNTPNLDGFTNAIWNDPNLQPVRLTLINFKPLLRDYLRERNGTRVIQEAWADLKAQIGKPASTIVERHAETYNIPLTGESK